MNGRSMDRIESTESCRLVRGAEIRLFRIHPGASALNYFVCVGVDGSGKPGTRYRAGVFMHFQYVYLSR